jgi:hypothetical protein
LREATLAECSKSRFDTSFDIGANLPAKKATAGGKKGKGGKRKLSPAQQYTAALYLMPRRNLLVMTTTASENHATGPASTTRELPPLNRSEVVFRARVAPSEGCSLAA